MSDKAPEKMRIEVIEPESFKHAGDQFDYEDIRTVPAVTGKYFCDNGWARDLSGKYPTAERDTKRKVMLSPEAIKLTNSVGGA